MNMGEKKLFIGIPVYSQVDVHFFASLLQFMSDAKEAGFNYKLRYVVGDSLVCRARNGIAMEFIKSDCTHLLFMDSDLVFSFEHVKRILSHDEDIVGGFYPKKKQGPVEFVFNCLQPPSEPDERGLSEVKYMGTGFLCISIAVFQKMIEQLWDDLIFKVDTEEKMGFDFFKVGVKQFPDGLRRYLSEDWYFCQLAKELGFKVWGDNRIILKHSGGAVYPLQTQEEELFAHKPKATVDKAGVGAPHAPAPA